MATREPAYWITTHWPPLVDRPHIMDVYVQDQHVAECGISRGDFVVFYEFKGGPVLIHPITGERIRRQPGRQGVVRASEVVSDFEKWEEGRQTYADGATIHWKWQAKARPIADGLVPKAQANGILGHKKENPFRGLNHGKGFQEIRPAQYAELLSVLNGQKAEPVPPSQTGD